MTRSKNRHTTKMTSLSAVRLPCASANLRRAARIVTQLYDAALRPTKMRSTQFTVLQAITFLPAASQKQLGELLGMDSTTLTRTLALLREHGWVTSRVGDDRRALRLALTGSGHWHEDRSLPQWQSAEDRLEGERGAQR